MRIIVVDDTLLFRKLISDVISTEPGFEVVKRCRDGAVAFEAIKTLKPDLITLDLDMPVMNGIELLEKLNREGISIGVIFVSAHTIKGGTQTLEALQKGAFDFITKPAEISTEKNIKTLKESLLPKIKIWEQSNRFVRDSGKQVTAITDVNMKIDYIPQVIAVGVSTGGPEALRQIIPKLSKEFNLPILIVQHMPPIFTLSLANILDQNSELSVKEAEDGDIVVKGNVYIAPGGKQMKVKSHGGILYIKITEDPPEANCKPSVNYLFRSLANNIPGKVLPVILTGMGNDGSLGIRLLKRHKCITVVQDESSSVVFGMPKAIIKQGSADIILPLEKIPEFFMGLNS